MATIKTSGLHSSFDRYNPFGNTSSYDSASELNTFLDNNFLISLLATNAGSAGLLVNAFAAQLKDILIDAEVSSDGKTAYFFYDSAEFYGAGITITGKNLGALQNNKGAATINSIVAGTDGFGLSLSGNILVNAKGQASGTVTNASVRYQSGEDVVTQLDLVGKASIKNNLLQSLVFSSATISTLDDDTSAVIDSATVAGAFKVTQNGVDGEVSAINFIENGETQLNVTGLKGVQLSDILENGFDKAFILSGADTITAVYTEANDYGDYGYYSVSDYGSLASGATIEGYSGSDTLIGGSRDDRLFGGTDNDILRGNDGNDYLDGGQGVDRLIGGAGNDIYVLDNTKDLVTEANAGGFDSLILEVSEDFTFYKMTTGVEAAYVDIFSSIVESKTESFIGGYEGIDVTIIGNTLDNLIAGGAGDDKLSGDSGNDILIGDGAFLYGDIGQRGLDFGLLGAGGDDTLDGGKGNDVLFGGIGNNVLTGGAGNDFFVYSSYQSEFGEDTNNRITDFKSGTDKLVLQLDNYYSYGIDGLSYSGSVSTENIPFFGSGLYTLSSEDFHRTTDFEAIEGFTESGVYFDTSDNKVWYVEYQVGSGGSGFYDTQLVATLDGNVSLKATDIAIADYFVG